MKISKRTLAILKNFANINQSLAMKQGNVIRTISDTRDFMAQAQVDETFEQEFAIYDLNEFLSAMSLFNEPDVIFEDDYLLIKEGKRSQKFWYADPAVITQPPSKEMKLPSLEVNVDISKEDLAALIKAASVNNASDVVFTGTKLDGQFVSIHDKTNPTSNTFNLSLADQSDAEYNMALTVDKFKFLPMDYNVQICVKGMAHFRNDEQNISYFLALAPGAKYAA